jgi:hypothetical protein
MTKPQYPSLGDIAKALFDHAGVLPKKNDDSGILIDEKTKKTIQTQLRRLAAEESELDKNLQQLLKLLAEFINKATGSPKVMCASMYSIEDIFQQYQNFVIGDTTFFTKRESIKWLIKNRLLDRIILSYQKNMLKFNVGSLNLITPDDAYWWLPDITESSIHSPLAKVMNWIYSVAGTSQTRFHFPDFGLTDNYRLSQNHENASRWVVGKNLPSWGSLLQNLEDSFSAMQTAQSEQYRRNLDHNTKESFKIILFIARFSSSVFIEIERQYGSNYIHEIVSHLKKQDLRLSRVHTDFKNIVCTEITSHQIYAPHTIDRIWFEETQAFWEQNALNIEVGSKSIDTRFIEKYSDGFDLKDIKYFLKYLNSFNLYPLLNQAKINVMTLAPPGYFEMFSEGFQLRKKSDASMKNINKYIDKVKKTGLEDSLYWLVNWVSATYHYRREEYDLAYPFYLQAFESGKYAAGNCQYKLVNQYLECCAKNGKWREFKKGIAWANYLEIEVRWYRGIDESDERIKTAYEWLKIAHYAQL